MATAATNHEALLRRFQPRLRYDSNEQYFADSAAQWTSNPGNELRRAGAGGSGAVIAGAVPTAGEPALELAFLGPQAYANGEPVAATDVIGDPHRDYRDQYVRLRTARPDLSNRMYGRAIEANERLWLQYWLWYFYNDYQLALGIGLHEGDWEMVQLRMHGDEPDIAVYAQHGHGEKRAWAEVERLDAAHPDTPVVYVARGSHASYFEPGFHATEAWYDLADGKRAAPRLELEVVTGGGHGWMLWPGRWGDTAPRDPNSKLDQPSPTGPGTKRQWRDPDRLLDDAVASRRREPPPAPDVAIVRDGARLRIDYDLSAREPPARALVVTVNSRDERGVPPRTHSFEEVAHRPRGSLETDVALDPGKHYDVYTSIAAGDPPVPSASAFTEIEPVGSVRPAPFAQRLAQLLSRVVARLRGDR